MDAQDKYELTRRVKELAAGEGALLCGISPAGPLPEEEKHLLDWLSKGFHGEMSYMENHLEKRVDPRKLVNGARSVISLLFNYFPGKKLREEDNYKISKYAYGKDYHRVLRKKMQNIVTKMEEAAGPFGSRVFTDSAPVLDRGWARRSGLGWVGKNTCLIHPKFGSFFFIAEIICDLDLEYDHESIRDFCGGCTKCIDSCPTGAIVTPRVLDSQRCISYLTIEYKGDLPEETGNILSDWIFGCDICQDVCPWNRVARPHEHPLFDPSENLMNMNREDWETLTEEDFNVLFGGTAVRRAGYDGLMRNINFVKEHRKKKK